jgi:hypothetical protein
MPTQTQEDAGQIAGSNPGIDQPAIERWELPSMMVERLSQRHATLQLVGDLSDCSRKPAAPKIDGDQAQTAINRKAGFGELSQLLIKSEKISRLERPSPWRNHVGRFQSNHAKLERGKAAHGRIHADGVNRSGQPLAIVGLSLVGKNCGRRGTHRSTV